MERQEKLSQALSLAADFYRAHGRQLPWREQSDPYRVFLSEIMLQQTRIEAVIPYYHRFLALYPTVDALANAKEEELLKAWEGLGYYSRARNLKRAAVRIMEAYDGKFPADLDALLTLPGVGRYTAGAIASICFGLPVSAVDGNVIRIYTRLFADGRCVTDEAFKRALTLEMDAAYPEGEAAKNTTQGLMEVGQRFCLPNGAPRCAECPLASLCAVAGRDDYRLYPHKEKKKPRKLLPRTVLLLTDGTRFYIRRREDTGLLAGLWEFPAEEGHLSPDAALRATEGLGLTPHGAVEGPDAKHIFTHLEWHMKSYLVSVTETDASILTPATWEEIKEKYPIASAFRAFLDYIEEMQEAQN